MRNTHVDGALHSLRGARVVPASFIALCKENSTHAKPIYAESLPVESYYADYTIVKFKERALANLPLCTTKLAPFPNLGLENYGNFGGRWFR